MRYHFELYNISIKPNISHNLITLPLVTFKCNQFKLQFTVSTQKKTETLQD